MSILRDVGTAARVVDEELKVQICKEKLPEDIYKKIMEDKRKTYKNAVICVSVMCILIVIQYLMFPLEELDTTGVALFLVAFGVYGLLIGIFMQVTSRVSKNQWDNFNIYLDKADTDEPFDMNVDYRKYKKNKRK